MTTTEQRLTMHKHACILMSVLYSPCVHCRDPTSSFIQLLLLLTSIDQFWRQVPFLTQCDLPALHARTCRSHGQHACQHSVQHPRHRRTWALPRDPPKMRPFGFPLFVAFEAAAMGCSLELRVARASDVCSGACGHAWGLSHAQGTVLEVRRGVDLTFLSVSSLSLRVELCDKSGTSQAQFVAASPSYKAASLMDFDFVGFTRLHSVLCRNDGAGVYFIFIFHCFSTK